MTDGERMTTGIVIALFVHFVFFACMKSAPPEVQTPTSIVVSLGMDAALATAHNTPSLQLENFAPNAPDTEQLANMKRKAYLDYLDTVNMAVHERRFLLGTTNLIGVATFQLLVFADGTFSQPALTQRSGSAALDHAAKHAIVSASGVVKRPALLGKNPLHVTLQVKYQFGL